MNRKIGLLPLGRSTFDVEFANQMLSAMLAALDATGNELVGPRELLFDAEATRNAIAELKEAGPTDLLILQVTFTDAAMTAEAAAAFDLPLGIWAVPEPRLGGRLRLNAFCGLNLAAHALGLRDRDFSWLYADPTGEGIGADLEDLLAGKRLARPVLASASADLRTPSGDRVVADLRGSRIGRIGEHPAGFDTCRYDSGKLVSLAGVEVSELTLGDLFGRAAEVPANVAAGTRKEAQGLLDGLDNVDQPQLDRSLRLKTAIEDIRKQGSFDAFAIRCWPETFTEYGGAVCGPVSMLGEKRLPCACEADVYGALTSLMLQKVADAPVFLVDLVDVDAGDNTAVVWHCGQAPVSMASPATHPHATIHTNRKMPLLFEFTLKPGRVTFARISQARGETRMVIASGEMLEAPMAFTGTSGVLRFDTPAPELLERIMGAALEHHMALAYGDHRDTLRGVAAALGIDILEL
ncbi:MAG TPA: hypothetical protein VIL84_08985 [Devosiaceae bacterium]